MMTKMLTHRKSGHSKRMISIPHQGTSQEGLVDDETQLRSEIRTFFVSNLNGFRFLSFFLFRVEPHLLFNKEPTCLDVG